MFFYPHKVKLNMSVSSLFLYSSHTLVDDCSSKKETKPNIHKRLRSWAVAASEWFPDGSLGVTLTAMGDDLCIILVQLPPQKYN